MFFKPCFLCGNELQYDDLYVVCSQTCGLAINEKWFNKQSPDRQANLRWMFNHCTVKPNWWKKELNKSS